MSVALLEIEDYVISIWDTVLKLSVQAIPPLVFPSRKSGFLTGCIHITGAWGGAVTLDFPVLLARRAAQIMFGLSQDEITIDLMNDCVGELTNILGGNVKALLPGPSFLSLPVVADGASYVLRVLDSHVLVQAAFACDDQNFQVTVIERQTP